MTKRGPFAMPALDEAGDLILKTPSPRYPLLPELEFSALNLAAVAGVRVVEASLVKPDSVEGLPREFLDSGEHSLAVRRFDRAPGECRIHIEDFAQIVGAIDERKYTMANTETVLNMVRRLHQIRAANFWRLSDAWSLISCSVTGMLTLKIGHSFIPMDGALSYRQLTTWFRHSTMAMGPLP
jgi:hypothetical protein